MINKKLAAKIISVAKKEQKILKSKINDKEIIKKISGNKNFIKGVVDKYGWPSFSLVGKEGDKAAWLIVQHIQNNIKFQKKCLNLIKQEVKKGNSSRSNIAYLTDRIALKSKKQQTFGTQFIRNKEGNLELYKTKNLKKLNALRKKYNLSTIEEYEKKIKINN